MAKVTILALTLGRTEMTRRTWKTNLSNAGMDYDLFWFDNGSTDAEMTDLLTIAAPYRITWFEWQKDNTGIAFALNTMIVQAFARGADYVFTMANDIIEPDNWLSMRVAAAQAIERTGIVAIAPGTEGVARYHRIRKNGVLIDEGIVIGNYLVTKAAYNAVGLFSESYGIYGPIDLDYCVRLERSGFKNYYLSDQIANHLGDPAKNPPEYQKSKEASLAKSRRLYNENKKKYWRGVDLYQHHLSGKEC